MKTTFKLLIVCIAIGTLFSCNDDSEVFVENVPYNQVDNAVSTLSDEAIVHITTEVLDNKIVFDENTSEDLIPKVGTIIQAPISEKTPYGFLGKVVSVEKGNGYAVITEQVALDEAYPNLYVDTTFNFIDVLDGVYDEDGTPVEYEIIYDESGDADTRAGLEISEDKIGKIKVPIKNEKLGEFTVGGYFVFDFGMGDFSIDNKHGLKYLNIEATPTIDANVQLGATLKEKSLFERKTKRYRFTGRVVPAPGIIVPITVYANFVVGAKGDISTSATLQFQKSSHWYVRYENEQWARDIEPVGGLDGDPWYVTQFDFNGELYGGLECGILFGLYTATSGLGVNLLPKLSLEAEASLSNIDPFTLNPEVSINGKLESSIYCIAELFGKKLAKWEVKLPEATFYKDTLPLFPDIENFTATGGHSSAEISYQDNSWYFLRKLGVETGAVVYHADKETELNTYYPGHSSSDENGIRYYNVNVSGLQSGQTYYAAPVVSWLLYKWTGEKHEFTTEASYQFYFRCVGQSYDIISFTFSLNDSNSNSFMVTAEGQDYNNGPYFNAIIKGSLNTTANTIDGTVEMNFIGLPEQRRIDAFSIPLGSDGYVDTSKVLDNGACYTTVRISNKSNANTRSYDGVVVGGESDCNVGLSIY